MPAYAKVLSHSPTSIYRATLNADADPASSLLIVPLAASCVQCGLGPQLGKRKLEITIIFLAVSTSINSINIICDCKSFCPGVRRAMDLSFEASFEL